EWNAAEHRRDVDDVPAAALLEMRQDLLCAVPHGLDVDAPHLVDVVVGEWRRNARDPSAGVVDPDIDVAEPADRLTDDALNVLPTPDVGHDDERALPALLGDGPELCLPPSRAHDGTASGG